MVLGEHAVALLPGFPHPLVIGGSQVELSCLPAGQERQLPVLPVGSFQQRVQRQAAELLQKFSSLFRAASITGRAGLRRPAAHRRSRSPARRWKDNRPDWWCGQTGRLQRRPQHRTGGDAVVSRFQPVGQRCQLCHNGVAQQGAENNKPVEPGVPFTKLHHQTLLLTGPLRHISPASPLRGAGQADGEVFTRLYTQRRLSARVCSIIFIFRLIHFTNRRLTKARFIV